MKRSPVTINTGLTFRYFVVCIVSSQFEGLVSNWYMCLLQPVRASLLPTSICYTWSIRLCIGDRTLLAWYICTAVHSVGNLSRPACVQPVKRHCWSLQPITVHTFPKPPLLKTTSFNLAVFPVVNGNPSFGGVTPFTTETTTNWISSV